MIILMEFGQNFKFEKCANGLQMCRDYGDLKSRMSWSKIKGNDPCKIQSELLCLRNMKLPLLSL